MKDREKAIANWINGIFFRRDEDPRNSAGGLNTCVVSFNFTVLNFEIGRHCREYSNLSKSKAPISPKTLGSNLSELLFCLGSYLSDSLSKVSYWEGSNLSDFYDFLMAFFDL